MKSVRAGRLEYRIQIVAVSESDPNPDGSPTYNETVIDTVWGSWEEVGGGESIVASKVSAETTDIVQIRPFTGLTAKHRLRVSGKLLVTPKTLEILAINDVEGRGRLQQI